MGWFTSKKDAANWDAKADEATKTARDEAQKADTYRKSLASGSDDPAADRYMLRQHDSARLIAEANAKDFRSTAKACRRWF